MSNKASTTKSIQLEDTRINQLTEIISSFEYTEDELLSRVLPYVAQWLYNENIAIESTCLLISNIVDVSKLQYVIDGIYAEIVPPYSLSNLKDYLSTDEYTKLQKAINKKQVTTISGNLDEDINIITNFETQTILQEKIHHGKNGDVSTFTPVISAVPEELVVYDTTFIEQPRSFKITWKSRFSERKFITTGEGTGATVNEISKYLIDAGYAPNPKLAPNAITIMINSMISNELAVIKKYIDNKGVYYNKENDKVSVVKMNTEKPSIDEMLKAHEILVELSEEYSESLEIYATVFKWTIMSVFHYAMKQAGNEMEYLYITGASNTGKTTLAKAMMYIYDKPTHILGGSSFNTEYRMGNVVSEDCLPKVINEPASVFNRSAVTEQFKLITESTICRVVKGKVVPAFAPVIFTANMFCPDDDAILTRLLLIEFPYNQRKSLEEMEEFNKKYMVKRADVSPLNKLEAFGRFFVNEIINDPSLLLDNWQETADELVNRFYLELGVDKPDWLNLWVENNNLEEHDDNQIESLRGFFINEFNNARKRVKIVDEEGFNKEKPLYSEVTGYVDFDEESWDMVNQRMFNWAVPHKTRDGVENICLTRNLRKELIKSINYDGGLNDISQLLGWDYKQVKIGGKNSRVIICPFMEFMSFVYPSIGVVSDE